METLKKIADALGVSIEELPKQKYGYLSQTYNWKLYEHGGDTK
ncbi:hypothetical protein DRH29_06005 [candidate division Kazan bacterium]|uniref:HTH cro/C1-type domain-containing protein n=1 Tax=candidate division Kazan bacterium TaxID=2202143 RepID=A0A420ZAM3_UNCK3|nr:MAG: hypothetical protein DRH29_06005 [candidate division Kazan bacterium]